MQQRSVRVCSRLQAASLPREQGASSSSSSTWISTLLKKPMEHLCKQLNVPCFFWQGSMSEDEQDKIYKYTIVDFSLDHKFTPDSSPRMTFKMQKMGINGTVSHENSDLASTMHWIEYQSMYTITSWFIIKS